MLMVPLARPLAGALLLAALLGSLHHVHATSYVYIKVDAWPGRRWLTGLLLVPLASLNPS